MEEHFEKVALRKERPVVKALSWLVTAVCLLWLGWMGRALVPQAPAGAAGMPPAMAAMMGAAGAPPLVATAEVRVKRSIRRSPISDGLSRSKTCRCARRLTDMCSPYTSQRAH